MVIPDVMVDGKEVTFASVSELEGYIATLKSEALRWEKPAARWRKMRKAVAAHRKTTHSTSCGDLSFDEGFVIGVNAAIVAIDRVAGEDIPEEEVSAPNQQRQQGECSWEEVHKLQEHCTDLIHQKDVEYSAKIQQIRQGIADTTRLELIERILLDDGLVEAQRWAIRQRGPVFTIFTDNEVGKGARWEGSTLREVCDAAIAAGKQDPEQGKEEK